MKNKNRANSKKNSPRQQKELQDIFENALECVARLDVSESFLSVNSNFAQAYAYQAEEMVGMSSKDTVHTEDVTIFEEAYQQMLKQGRAEIDVRGIRKDSSVFYKHVVMVKGLSDDKSAIGHYCFIQDITERILNQQALRDQAKLQSEQLHSLIKNIQGVVYRCNTKNWQFEYLGENITELLGIPENEVPENARTLFIKYTHKQDIKKLIEIIKLEIPKDGKYEIEYRVVCKDGSIKWLQNRATGVFNDEQKLTCIDGVLLDITRQKQTEQDLNASKLLLTTAIETSPTVMCISRIDDGKILKVNRSFESMFGYTREDILDTSAIDLWPDPKERDKLIKVLKEKGNLDNFECSFRHKDGHIAIALMSAHVIDVDGETCIFSAGHDISKRKQIELALKESQVILNSAFESSPDSITISRLKDGTFISVNAGYTKISGYSQEELIGKSSLDLGIWVNEKDRTNFVNIIEQNGQCTDYEVDVRNKSGQIIHTQITGSTIHVGGESCLFAITRDMTQKKKEEESLLQIAKGVSAKLGEQFFTSLVEHLAQSLEVDYAFVASIDPENINHVRTIALYSNGKHGDNIEYDLVGTPCETVIGHEHEAQIFVDNVQQQFPNDKLLIEMEAQSYAGATLIDSLNEVMGLIVVIGKQPFKNSDRIFSTLQIFATRASAEVERLRSHKELVTSEENFKQAIFSTPSSITIVTVDEGEIVEVNDGFCDISGYNKKEILGQSILKYWLHPEERENFIKVIQQDGFIKDFQQTFLGKGGKKIGVSVSSVIIDYQGSPCIFSVTNDITERKLFTERLDRTNRALRVLNECNYGLTHITDEQELLQYICKVIIDTGGYRFTWVGYAQNDKRKTVQPMARAGFEEGYLDNVILWADKSRGRGPSGKCIRESSPQICKNINEAPCFKPWCKPALERGYSSVVALPLIMDSETIGALMIYSSEIEIFDTDEVKLLSNLAENLAFGIRSARLKEESRLADIILRNNEIKFRETFGNAPVGMVMVNSHGVLMEANKAALKLSGLSKQEFVGSNIAAITHPDDLEISMKYFKDLWAGNIDTYTLEKRYLHKDGHTIHCILHGSLVHDENNNPLFMVGQAEDITDKKHFTEALAASEAKFKMLYHDTPAMFFNIDRGGKILSVNEYGAKQLGYTVDELISTDIASIIHEEDRSLVKDNLTDCVESPEQVHRWEIRKLRKDGEVIWVRESVRVMSADDATTFFIVCEDITETYRLSQQLSYQATHDSLTGLVNRAEFERRLQRVLKINDPKRTEHATCYLDLDQFKIINDTCGHLAGDELLRQLSELLLAKVRKRDTLARLGGDEFGVLMEHCDLNHARRVADLLRATVEDFRFVWQDKKFSIGVSIGLVPINVSSGNVNDILSAADAACYAAKDAGRNRIHVYANDDKSVAIRRGEMQWVSRINHALEEGLFKLYYQKIVSVNGLKQGEHYELLLRMTGSNGELIPPGAFLSAAERYGLSNKIDSWVVNKAFTWLVSHPAKLKKLHICAINLSGQSLGNEEFMQGLLNDLNESGIPANKICFEITETAAIANLASAIRFINKFRSKGCLFALDDFGSGVSSFGYLKNLPVDYLKIDGSFVRDIANDKIDRAMVKSINEIGQIMGKETIAEFVENDAILKELKKLGVDYAQGYGIGKPRPLYYSKKK